jgi:hypothetical protein
MNDTVPAPVADPAALAAALRQAADAPAGGPAGYPAIQPCPLQALTWFCARLVDEAGAPVADEPWLIIGPDGVEHRGRTDADGIARVDQIPPGTCRISYTQRDAAAWSPL